MENAAIQEGEYFSPTHHKITNGLYTLFNELGASVGILAIVGSWGDTMNSENTLEMLEDYIESYVSGRVESERQC